MSAVLALAISFFPLAVLIDIAFNAARQKNIITANFLNASNLFLLFVAAAIFVVVLLLVAHSVVNLLVTQTLTAAAGTKD